VRDVEVLIQVYSLGNEGGVELKQIFPEQLGEIQREVITYLQAAFDGF